jgi:hypothetical protein
LRDLAAGLQRFRAARADRDIDTLPSQGKGDRLADPRTRPGDQCLLSVHLDAGCEQFEVFQSVFDPDKPGILGAGRFANIGIPYPEVMGPFVGTVEVVCGSLIILGLFTRLAAIPLIVIMVVAIVSTKLPIWAGHDIWIFHMPKLARYSFGAWRMKRATISSCCSDRSIS